MAGHRQISKVDWGRAIKKLMVSNKVLKTQTALARRSGVPQSTIGRILRGDVNPQAANLERIAHAFGVSFATLAEMGLEGNPVLDNTRPEETGLRLELMFRELQPGEGEEWIIGKLVKT